MYKKFGIGLSFVVVLMFTVSLVGAQATAVPLTTADLLSGGTDLINSFGLFALVSVAAFIGIAAMLVMRMKRAAR